MPSMYDAVFPKIPKEDPNPGRTAQLSAAMQEYADLTPAELGRAYAILRTEKDLLKLQLSELQVKVEAAERMLELSQDMDDPEDWGTYGAEDNVLRLITGDKIEVRKEINVKTYDPAAVRQWAMKLDPNLLTVHAQRLESLTKELLVKGKPAPPGVRPSWWTKIFYTAAK